MAANIVRRDLIKHAMDAVDPELLTTPEVGDIALAAMALIVNATNYNARQFLAVVTLMMESVGHATYEVPNAVSRS